jgi:hypothetical protein
MVFDVNSLDEKFRVRELQFILYSPLLYNYQQQSEDIKIREEQRRIYQTLYYFLTAKRQAFYLYECSRDLQYSQQTLDGPIVTSSAPLRMLPVEVCSHIFTFLSLAGETKSLASACIVNSQWYSFVKPFIVDSLLNSLDRRYFYKDIEVSIPMKVKSF